MLFGLVETLLCSGGERKEKKNFLLAVRLPCWLKLSFLWHKTEVFKEKVI